MTALVAYTWSKSINETSGIRTEDSDSLFSQNGNCQRCEQGLSAFDVRHRLVVSGLYDLPIGKGRKLAIRNRFADVLAGGWQLGSIVTWRSGFPINPTDGMNRANTRRGARTPQRRASAAAEQPRRRERWHLLRLVLAASTSATVSAINVHKRGKTRSSVGQP